MIAVRADNGKRITVCPASGIPFDSKAFKRLDRTRLFAIMALMKREMSAGLVIRDGRLLLVHNSKQGLRIEPPGGKKEPGETWERSVEREFEEELGLKVRVKRLLGAYDTHSPEGEFSVRLYICEIIAGEPKVMEPDKVPGFGWYTIADIEVMKASGELVPNMVAALEDIRPFMG